MNLGSQIAIGLGLISLLMIATYFYCWRKQNFGYVDVVWSYSVGLLALLYFFLGNSISSGTSLLALALCLAWSIRLGTHLLIRVSSEEEDGRYQEIRTAWEANLKRNTFVFFQFQAIAASFMSLAPLVLFNSDREFGAPVHWLGIAVAAIAVAGESLADHQLSRFRRSKGNKGKTCRVGLWSLSRHPNYFFEWLYWCSFPVLAIGTGYFWLSIASPAVLLFLILRVTGIPPTEKNALKSRGDDYRRYQRETNAFFPWPRNIKATRTEQLTNHTTL